MSVGQINSLTRAEFETFGKTVIFSPIEGTGFYVGYDQEGKHFYVVEVRDS